MRGPEPPPEPARSPATIEPSVQGDPAPLIGEETTRDESLVRLAFITPTGRPVELVYPQRSRSVGRPTQGHLENSRCLPPSGPGFVAISEARCGTDETVTLLLFAISELMREYPGSAPVVIGALSKPEGGRLRPHKSHRSGRDVDIGYFAKDNRPLRTFADLSPEEIDYDKTFFLMATLLATGRVDFIFVNYRLQPRFIEAARRMGYDEEQIAYIFQYPRGRRARVGLIRHANGHTRHFHVRFSCPQNDRTCVQE